MVMVVMIMGVLRRWTVMVMMSSIWSCYWCCLSCTLGRGQDPRGGRGRCMMGRSRHSTIWISLLQNVIVSDFLITIV